MTRRLGAVGTGIFATDGLTRVARRATAQAQALDAEYNNREKVKDSADWISRYAIASAETRAALECRLDLAYGTHPGETLDVFPARRAPAPVHVFVHGGYWQRLDKADSSFVARAPQAARAAGVVIKYVLIPGGDLRELVRQC